MLGQKRTRRVQRQTVHDITHIGSSRRLCKQLTIYIIFGQIGKVTSGGAAITVR